MCSKQRVDGDELTGPETRGQSIYSFLVESAVTLRPGSYPSGSGWKSPFNWNQVNSTT